ncbi:MAG: hypothetical protein ABI346_02125 [Candidatus Baltobacteraceae bacterium]
MLLASGAKTPFAGKVVKIADPTLDAAIVSIDVGALPVALLASNNPPEGKPIIKG